MALFGGLQCKRNGRNHERILAFLYTSLEDTATGAYKMRWEAFRRQLMTEYGPPLVRKRVSSILIILVSLLSVEASRSVLKWSATDQSFTAFTVFLFPYIKLPLTPFSGSARITLPIPLTVSYSVTC